MLGPSSVSMENTKTKLKHAQKCVIVSLNRALHGSANVTNSNQSRGAFHFKAGELHFAFGQSCLILLRTPRTPAPRLSSPTILFLENRSHVCNVFKNTINMAMLAAPRRKQKVINLRAKNNAWSNDSNKYGLRMLVSMGWTMGKGLGPKENGMVEHVVARYKNDDAGLGFKDRNDQWTKHEDDFNTLLANLSNGDSNDEKLHSGVSLEDKSKKSKKRVHYHKFTRGKDLTRYSEKDLANIFGKKTLKNEENSKPEENKQAVENTVITNTEVVFTEKGSMEDYFKSKMAAMKSKFNITTDDSSYRDIFEYSFKDFTEYASDKEEEKEESHLGLGFKPFSFETMEDNDEGGNKNEVSESEEMSIKTKKKNKKKKKQKHPNQEEITEEIVDDMEYMNTQWDEPEKTKKSKKKKQQNFYEKVKSKKSKKKKDGKIVEEAMEEN